MDILYITQEIEDRMRELCSERVIDNVFDDFRRFAAIQKKAKNQTPSRVWVISDYIRNGAMNIVDKMNVILSFVACGGIVQFDGRNYLDIFNLIASIKQSDLINDEQLEIIYEPWYQCYYKKILPRFE